MPWGLYKAINYVKEHYGNPTIILAENGMVCLTSETFIVQRLTDQLTKKSHDFQVWIMRATLHFQKLYMTPKGSTTIRAICNN